MTKKRGPLKLRERTLDLSCKDPVKVALPSSRWIRGIKTKSRAKAAIVVIDSRTMMFSPKHQGLQQNVSPCIGEAQRASKVQTPLSAVEGYYGSGFSSPLLTQAF